MERYGVENVFSLEHFKEKSRKTKLEKYGDEYFTNIPKQKQWYRNNYGVEWNTQVPHILEKQKNTCRKTNEANGNWITEELVKDFKDYARLVWRYTNKNDLSTLENFEKRGQRPEDYHLDHKYSIFQGFKDNIPAKIIGNICNLKMLQSGQNLSKNKKCSISIEELMSSIEEL